MAIIALILAATPAAAQDFWDPPIFVPGLRNLRGITSGPDDAYACGDAVYRSTDRRKTWTKVLDVPCSGLSGPDGHRVTLVGTPTDGVWETTDGENWTHHLPGIAVSSVLADGDWWYVGASAGQVFRRKNGAWASVNPELPFVTTETVDEIAAVEDAFVYRLSGSPATGVYVPPSDVPTETTVFDDVRDVAADFFSSSLYLAAGFDILSLPYHGQTWSPVATNPAFSLGVREMIVSGGGMLVSDPTGAISLSDYDGQTWFDAESGVQDASAVHGLTFARDGYAYVIVDSLIYRSSRLFARTIRRDKGSSVEIPQNLSIDEVYPNPISGEWTIELSVPTPQRVRIELVDLLGRVVLHLEEEALPGRTRVFTRLDIAPGTYVLRVAGRGVQTRIVVVQ